MLLHAHLILLRFFKMCVSQYYYLQEIIQFAMRQVQKVITVLLIHFHTLASSREEKQIMCWKFP